jgi:hypothetical protein
VLCIHFDGGTRYYCARFVISGCRIGTLVWYAIVHCARGGTLDGVHNGEELAADKYVATGKNSATGG